jgi:hypothetical protein
VECRVALFETFYGTDTSKVEIWLELCRKVYVLQSPDSITGCKKVKKFRVMLLTRLLICPSSRVSERPKFWSI